MSSSDLMDSIIADVLRSKKYRHIGICEDTVRDLVAAELQRYKRRKDVLKAVRAKLHRIVALHLGDPDYPTAICELEVAFRTGNSTAVRQACAKIMETHISTRERLLILEDFYQRIFAVTGIPHSLLDLACGLNPLSFPWMELPVTTRYYAYDIRPERIGLINRYFSLQGLLPLAKVQDIIVNPPTEEAHIAFIFKEVHRFEHRQRGCSLLLLDALHVPWVVVSLPTESASGQRDLTDHHRRLLYSIVSERPWHVQEITFENELVFCINKF